MRKVFAGCEAKRGERGATVVLFTLVVSLVLIPLIGLAIDGSIVFWTKARLSAAVDAAALAAGRQINPNLSTSQNQANVVTVAGQWFAANFPNGWLGATTNLTPPTLTPSNQVMTVNVSASATVPLYFMRLGGVSSMTVSASAQSARRNTFVVMVLDRSGSMNRSGSCSVMQADAVNFVNMFQEGLDQMALVTFQTTANLDYYSASNPSFKAGMTTAINSLVCANGATNMTNGLNVAFNTIKTNNLQSGLNVIVLFTDGLANAITAKYPIKAVTDTRWGAGDDADINVDGNSYSAATTYGPTGCPGTAATTIDGVMTTVHEPNITMTKYGLTLGLLNPAGVPSSSDSAILILRRPRVVISWPTTTWCVETLLTSLQRTIGETPSTPGTVRIRARIMAPEAPNLIQALPIRVRRNIVPTNS